MLRQTQFLQKKSSSRWEISHNKIFALARGENEQATWAYECVPAGVSVPPGFPTLTVPFLDRPPKNEKNASLAKMMGSLTPIPGQVT